MTAELDTTVFRDLKSGGEYASFAIGTEASSLSPAPIRATRSARNQVCISHEGETPFVWNRRQLDTNHAIGLSQRLAKLEQEIAMMWVEIARMRESANAEAVVEEPEQTDYETAKELVRSLFASRGTLSYSDLISDLGLDLDTVIQACDDLAAEGRIRECSEPH